MMTLYFHSTAVFGADAGKADDGRHVVKGVKKTVGREVKHAVAALAGDPADGPRRNDAVKRVVSQAVAQGWLVKMHF